MEIRRRWKSGKRQSPMSVTFNSDTEPEGARQDSPGYQARSKAIVKVGRFSSRWEEDV